MPRIDAVQDHERRGQLRRLRERPVVDGLGALFDDRGQALEPLDAALRLPRLAGLGAEAFDEALHMRGLPPQLLVRGLLLREPRHALRLEAAEVARIGIDAAVVDMQHAPDHRVEEITVVRDYEQRAGVGLQPALEPQYGVEVEVVGRFVEQQQVRRAHQRAGEVGAHAQAARELRDRPVDVGRSEAESVEQPRCTAARGVRAAVLELCVQAGLCDAVARRLSRRERALRRPQRGVAVDHMLHHRPLRMRQFLRHGGDGETGRALESAAIGRELALQQGEQRRLAAAVAADHADLLAAQQAERRAFDQGVRSAPQADIAQVDHGRDSTRRARPCAGRVCCAACLRACTPRSMRCS